MLFFFHKRTEKQDETPFGEGGAPKGVTPETECGEDLKSQPQNKGSKSWAHRWAMKIFVREHLERTREKHRILLRRIPIVPDVQSTWLLLLRCASTRANKMLRVVRPEWALDFAQAHDQEVWECLCSILAVLVGEE